MGQKEKENAVLTARLSREIDAAYKAYKPGNQKAENSLYATFCAQALNIFRLYFSPEAPPLLHDEIAQDAMRNLHEFDRNEKLSTWFCRMVWKEAKRARRRLLRDRANNGPIGLPVSAEPLTEFDEYPKPDLEQNLQEGPPKSRTFDFISEYANYADVMEAPREAHEAVATVLLAAILCEKVQIKHGAIEAPLDIWLLFLSGSGLGRNTLLTLAQPVLKAANLSGMIYDAAWGSRSAFYQQIAEQPCGLFVWPELSVILKTLKSSSLAGTKDWLTDRYDNPAIPQAVRYRMTNKKSDTPPIVFDRAPRINILATSSVDWFLSNISVDDVRGGFVPRWILRKIDSGRIVPTPKTPDGRLIKPLAEHLRKVAELSGEADLSQINKYYDVWYRQTRSRFSEHPNAPNAIIFFNRLRTHVLKLALVYEVSQSVSLAVTPASFGRAVRAAKASEESIFALLATGISREGTEVNKMAEVIRRAGPDGISKSGLTRSFQHLGPAVRERRLTTLVEAKGVHRFWRGTSGRKAEIFVHNDCLAGYKRLHPEDTEG
jgi:DNA-directed RNA polymerase specialized sigma24 family protein